MPCINWWKSWLLCNLITARSLRHPISQECGCASLGMQLKEYCNSQLTRDEPLLPQAAPPLPRVARQRRCRRCRRCLRMDWRSCLRLRRCRPTPARRLARLGSAQNSVSQPHKKGHGILSYIAHDLRSRRLPPSMLPASRARSFKSHPSKHRKLRILDRPSRPHPTPHLAHNLRGQRLPALDAAHIPRRLLQHVGHSASRCNAALWRPHSEQRSAAGPRSAAAPGGIVQRLQHGQRAIGTVGKDVEPCFSACNHRRLADGAA